MRKILVMMAVAATTAACKGERTDADKTPGVGADTMVTERTVQDTTVVTHDTTVRVDTMVKRGGTVDADTTRGGRRP
jgi:hypothetical protein